MLLRESSVPQMMAFRLAVLCHLHSIMIHIIMRSLWQRMRLITETTIDMNYSGKHFLLLLLLQAAKQGIRDSWSSWNPQRQAAHELQQLVQSGQIRLQDTVLAQRQVGAHPKQEPLAGSIPAADAKARGWVGHPKPFAWPAAKDAQVGGESGNLTAVCQAQDLVWS